MATHAALACDTPAGAVRLARLLRRLPPPGRAGQRHRHDRPPLGRPGRPRPRRRLEPDRVRRLRHPVPADRRPPRPARGGHPVRPGPAPRRGHRLRRATGSSSATPAASPSRCRPSCRSGSAAQGEQRTLRIAARCADGWNVPFVAPETFAHKRGVLDDHCADVGRDPAEIRIAVNVGLAWTEESLRQQFGGLADFVRPGVLTGSEERGAGPHRRSTSTPAPTRSTWPCGRRSTPTRSIASPPRWVYPDPDRVGSGRRGWWVGHAGCCWRRRPALRAGPSRSAATRCRNSLGSVPTVGRVATGVHVEGGRRRKPPRTTGGRRAISWPSHSCSSRSPSCSSGG